MGQGHCGRLKGFARTRRRFEGTVRRCWRLEHCGGLKVLQQAGGMMGTRAFRWPRSFVGQ